MVKFKEKGTIEAFSESYDVTKLGPLDDRFYKLKENLSQLAARQQKYITNLENALVRIKNGTYGICSVTGKLISKERLIAVPHTTQSIEAKMMQQD